MQDMSRSAGEIALVVVGYVGTIVAGAKYRWLDVVFALYVGISSVAILGQNAQLEHFFSFIALFAHMGTVCRSIAARQLTRLSSFLPAALAALFILPSMKQQWAATIEHVQGIGRPDHAVAFAALDDVFVSEKAINVFSTGLLSGDPATLFLHARSTKPARRLSQAEYVFALQRGLDLLTRAGVQKGSILNLDFANAFPVLSGLDAPRGVPVFFHIGRTFAPATTPAADIFKDVDLIVVPKFNTSVRTRDVMLNSYGDYIDRTYQLLGENECWTLLRRSHGAKSTARAVPRP